MVAQRILSVAQTCQNSALHADWYCQALGFSLIKTEQYSGSWLKSLFSDPRLKTLKSTLLALGRERLQLWEWELETTDQTAISEQSNKDSAASDWLLNCHGYDLSFQHICIVSNDIKSAYAKASAAGSSSISSSIQTLPQWNIGAAGIQAVKFFDQQGHPLELLQFPPDKGDPRWHQEAEATNASHQLGLDHTAISISDTSQSLSFYVDLLGFSVAGGGLNHGIEQEQLDHVKDALVQITSLRPADQGMGVEFLNYQKPTNGRPRTTPAAVTDLCDWRIILEVNDLDQHHQLIQASPWASNCGRIMEIDSQLTGQPRGFVVRDPDLHALLLVGD